LFSLSCRNGFPQIFLILFAAIEHTVHNCTIDGPAQVPQGQDWSCPPLIYAFFSLVFILSRQLWQKNSQVLSGGNDTLELLALLSGLDALTAKSGAPGAGLCRALAVADDVGSCDGERTRAIGSRGGTSAVASCNTFFSQHKMSKAKPCTQIQFNELNEP
jgi:hypothetical protein